MHVVLKDLINSNAINLITYKPSSQGYELGLYVIKFFQTSQKI